MVSLNKKDGGFLEQLNTIAVPAPVTAPVKVGNTPDYNKVTANYKETSGND